MIFPKISAKRVKLHGIDDWAFPSLDFNPHAPQIPGAPGLFYVPQDASGKPYTKRVIVRLDQDKWLYVGLYSFIALDSLTSAEYAQQSTKVRSRLLVYAVKTNMTSCTG